MMKKSLLILPALLSCSLLFSSCSLLTGRVDSYMIANVTHQTDADDNTQVRISFQNGARPDFVFTVAGGADGLTGDSIASVSSEIKGDSLVLTLNYTDPSAEPTVITIPNLKGEDGRLVTGMTWGEDAQGDNTLVFSYSDGTESATLTLPNGKDGEDAKHLISSLQTEEVEEGTKVTFHYSDGSPDTVFILPKGNDGLFIEDVSIVSYGEDSVTYRFEFSDGSYSDVDLPYVLPQEWLTGAGAPVDGIGKKDDFYLNIRNGDFYVKEEGGWTLLLTIGGYEPEPAPVYCQVVFDAAGGTLPNGGGQLSFFVAEGSYLPQSILLDSIGIPEKDGAEFLGWYTSKTYDPNSGRFTDATPVLHNLYLYAWYDNN